MLHTGIRVYYKGDIGAYFALIDGREYRLLSIDGIAAKREAESMAKFLRG